MSIEMKKDLIKKHGELSDNDIIDVKRDIAKTRQKYARDQREMETNLIEYFERGYPLFEPLSGRQIAVIRLPSMEEYEKLMPPEGAEIDPESLPVEERLRYSRMMMEHLDNQLKVLSQIIITPKKSPKEWKKLATPQFIALVQERMVELLTDMGRRIENFQQAPKE